MTDIVLILHDIRSTYNVGSLLRTADGIGVSRIYFTGYTPYPQMDGDTRLPHISSKLTAQIHKTALGAEHSQNWQYTNDIKNLLDDLRTQNYKLLALEQSADSNKLPDYSPPTKVAVLLGREVEGIDERLLALVDDVVEIPMFGSKESFNVVQAAAILLYHLRFR